MALCFEALSRACYLESFLRAKAASQLLSITLFSTLEFSPVKSMGHSFQLNPKRTTVALR